jgi:ribosomal protein L9
VVRLSAEDKQLEKSRAIEKLLSAQGLAITFSADQLEALYGAVKSF